MYEKRFTSWIKSTRTRKDTHARAHTPAGVQDYTYREYDT